MNGPRLVFWETTAACNLRCKHCRRLDVLDKPSADQLNTEAALSMIDEIARTGAGILVFSGGEPLKRPDLLTLLAHARACGLRTAVATNGTLVDESWAWALKNAGVSRVSVSLDGARPATHERLRGPGSFQEALNGITHLIRQGVPTQVNFTVTRMNAKELPLLYERCLSMGVCALHLFLLVPVGCGATLPQEVELSAEEVEQWLLWLADREKENAMEIKATCAPQYYRIRAQKKLRQPGPHRASRGCLAGSEICFISHRGEVFPCGYLPVRAGDLRQQDFGEIWRDSPVFGDLRNPSLITGKCGVCPFLRVCSGCRARAFAASGDYLGEETSCAYTPPRIRHSEATEGDEVALSQQSIRHPTA